MNQQYSLQYSINNQEKLERKSYSLTREQQNSADQLIVTDGASPMLSKKRIQLLDMSYQPVHDCEMPTTHSSITDLESVHKIDNQHQNSQVQFKGLLGGNPKQEKVKHHKKRRRIYTQKKRKHRKPAQKEVIRQFEDSTELDNQEESLIIEQTNFEEVNFNQYPSQNDEICDQEMPPQESQILDLQQQPDDRKFLKRKNEIELSIEIYEKSEGMIRDKYRKFENNLPLLEEELGTKKAQSLLSQAQLDVFFYDPNFDLFLQSKLLEIISMQI